jgi:hypothetical protein
MTRDILLVGGIPTPLKNISQLGWLFPIYGKIKAMFQTTNQSGKIVLQCGTGYKSNSNMTCSSFLCTIPWLPWTPSHQPGTSTWLPKFSPWHHEPWTLSSGWSTKTPSGRFFQGNRPASLGVWGNQPTQWGENHVINQLYIYVYAYIYTVPLYLWWNWGMVCSIHIFSASSVRNTPRASPSTKKYYSYTAQHSQ